MNKYLYAFLCVCFSILQYGNAQAQAPVANFSASSTSGCSPIVSNFTDLSTNSPTSWYWDLGNGSTSTLQNPSTTYINPGVYTVFLVATNGSGSDTQVFTNYITVAPSPTVAFTADSTPSCQVPRTISFTNNSVPGGSGTTTYLWDFGDGNTSSAANPSHTYTSFGNYTVTLLVTNGNGCSKSLIKTNYIKILAKPTANFIASGNNSCTAPVTTTFTNTSSNAVSYEWSFGDGGTSTSASPTHTYTTNGVYNVRLIATNAAGCKDTFTSNSLVNIGAPNASFNASTLTACTGKTISFTNTSTPAGYTSDWTFGTGGTSVSTSPTYTYSSTGTYTVTLIVTRNGCSDTDSKVVTVNQSPTINFTASPTDGCSVPFTTTFSNSTTNAVSYLWRFGDGNTSTSANPSNTYNALGNYSVKLIATSASGCTDSFTRTNYIKIQLPTANINVGTYSGCAPVNVPFIANITSLIPVSNYTWDFGDGSSTVSCASCSTQSHVYTTPGNYTVTLNFTTGTGCTFTRTTTVSISTRPTAAFSASPLTICPGSPVTFSNSSTGATGYTWFYGNGATSTATNPVYNGYTRGVYTVTLVANNNGCRDTAVRTNYITVHPPEANFGLATSCTNRTTVTLTDSSIGADTYSWDFGDGSTSTQVGGTLTHTYLTSGTKTITLNVYNTTYGCSSTISRTVNIQPLSPAFTVTDTTLCKGEVTAFAVNTLATGNLFTWYFGNNTSFTTAAESLYYSYPAGGTYSPKLVVTDANGCKDSLTKINHIRVGSPNVDFSGTPLIGCLPFTATFTDLSTPNGGFAITNRVWDFVYGGPQPTTNTTISYTYIYGGNWPVKLVVTDANGCKDSLIKNNYVIATKPVAQFSSADTNICVGQTVQMYNNSGGASFTCLWHWGDGTTSTQLTPSHTYATAGTYTVKLVVTDMYGCMDSTIKTAYVKVNSPTINFTMSDTVANCPPLVVNFTNTSTGVSTYTWSFGNGGQSSLANPSALYTYPGVYNIKLIGTTNAGCKDSVTKHVTIYGPTGTFTYSPLAGCNPVTVNFTATTVNATSLIWDMSNGFTQTTTGNTYSYTYTQTGKYLPKLILSDGASCLVPIFGTDTVKVDKMDADFSYSPNVICNAGTVQFTDTVLYTLSNVVSRSWDFGDGGNSTAHNPTHAYTTAGNYNVRLIVTNAQGCKDTTIKTVVIYAPPTVVVTGSSTICQGATTGVTLTASGATSYVWTPAGTLSCSTCAITTALPTSTTTYIVTGTDGNGCTDTAQVTVNVNNRPNVSAVSNKTAVCAGTTATLTASGATSYVWTPAGTLSCSTCVSPVATPTTATTYIVTGTDGNGCTDTGVVTVNVNPLPTVGAGSNVTICNGTSTTLTGSGATGYVWTPATTLSCATCASPVATPTTTTTYTVTGTDGNGCTNTATVTVNVNNKPTVTAGSNVAICNGTSTTLSAGGATSYVWAPAGTLSCSTCANPVATPTTTTTYTVTGTDGNGCTNTATVTVTVNPLPNVTATSNKTSVCIGSTATLTATGATSYVWTPAGTLSCSTCANPVATPTGATTYIVTGTDGNGCTDTGVVTVNVNPLPVVSAGSNVTICNGSSTTLTATGATGYVWTPATTLSCATCASPVATPTTTTTYTVTGTDGNGCSNTATVTVNVNNKPTVSAGSNVAICNGASTTLGASGATSYVWTPSGSLSCSTCANPIATPTTTTTYTVTGTDGNGCSNTATVMVTVNNLPNVTASGSSIVCNGSSTTLTASGATSYVWTPASTLSCSTCASPVATPTTVTTYIVTGTDGNGCVDTGMITISINVKPDVDAGLDKTVCYGASANLSATGAVNYQWSPSTGLSCTACASPVATPTTTTLYRVIGVAANGCSDTDFVNVTVNPLPNVTATGASVICAGTNTILTATGATSYVWTPAGSLSCSTCNNPVATPTTTTSYVVTGTDGNGCIDTGKITVTVNPLPLLQVTGAGTICEGTTKQLNVTGAASYNWTPATNLSCTACSNPVASPTTTTIYTVTGTTNGCSSTATVAVNVLPKPVIYLTADTAVCQGQSVPLSVLGAATYVWTPSAGLSCNTCVNPIATPATTTTYVVTGTNSDGCSNNNKVTITVNPKPNINAGQDVVICEGSSAQLEANGAATYSWSPAATLSCTTCNNPVAKPIVNTTYTVIGKDNIGCSDSDKVTVSIIERGPVTYGPDAEFCVGGSAELYATGGSSYLWIPADGLSNHQVAKVKAAPNTSTKYAVIVKQGDCFVDTGYINVTVHQLPVVELGPDVTIVGGNSTQLKAVGENLVSYAWTPTSYLSCDNCENPVASPRRTTDYKVSVTDKYGCEGTDNIKIHVLCQNSQIFIPNTFTPNGDGVNDMFFPQGKGLDYVKSFRVYSRWGELIFSRDDMKINDPSAGWDGTFKSAPLKPDVFVYIIHAFCESGEPIELKGDISLVR